jgi:hypothetical protein
LDFIDFWTIFGIHSESFFVFVFLDQKKKSVFISISRLLFLLLLSLYLGAWEGLEKQAFGMEGIAKINFRRNWTSCDSRVDFS